MATHTYHALIGTHGLADRCVRCTDMAETPFESLDAENLATLVERTKRWMDDDPESVARSKNEQKAMTKIAEALQQRAILDRLEAENETVA